jgi:hypothetical protein
MKIGKILAAALLVGGEQLAGEAQARDQLNQTDPVVVAPQTAYLFVRTQTRLPLTFMREVSPAELTEWRAARAEALARAREHATRLFRQYQRAVTACEGRPAPCVNMAMPTAVTDENFAFTPPEADNFVSLNPGRLFMRNGDGDFGYFIAVQPGTYMLYGALALAGNVSGTCLCMGSVRFEARAGQITDLGLINSDVAVRPYEPGMARPDRLNGHPVVAAEWRAAGKVSNFFGILINRHPQLPGVLSYRRDRVIDERTGTDPVSLIEAAGATN